MSDRVGGRAPVRAPAGGVGGFAWPLALFMLAGLGIWGWNAARLLRGRATPAVVVSSSVREVRGRNATSYAPDVEYRYDVDGTTHTARTVLPGSGEARGQAWAARIAARYAPGDSTVAYVDPADPATAYLIRQPSSGALLFVAAPLVILGLLAVDRPGPDADPLPPPDPTPSGPRAWTLAPRDDPAAEARAIARPARRWQLAALALAALHPGMILVVAAGEHGGARVLATVWRATAGDGFFVFQAAALVGAGWYVGRRRRAAADTAERVRGARVVVDRAQLRAGNAVEAALQLSLGGRHVAVRETSLQLVRQTRERRGGRSGGREAYTPSGGAGPDGRADALHPALFALPAGAPHSSVTADDAARTTWAFVATVRFADGHSAELRFPVRVHAAEPAPRS